MDLATLLFLFVALLAVGSAILTVGARDPRIVSRARTVFLLALAPIYSQLGAPYLGLLQLAWAMVVGWRGRPLPEQESTTEPSWLPSVGLFTVGILSAALWWSTYQDFPRRPPRGAVATVWERPEDLLQPFWLTAVLLVLVLAIGWGVRRTGEDSSP